MTLQARNRKWQSELLAGVDDIERQVELGSLKKNWMVTKQDPDGFMLIETGERIVPGFELMEGSLVCVYVSIDMDTGRLGFPVSTSVPERLDLAQETMAERGFWFKEAARTGWFGSQRTAAFVRLPKDATSEVSEGDEESRTSGGA